MISMLILLLKIFRNSLHWFIYLAEKKPSINTNKLRNHIGSFPEKNFTICFYIADIIIRITKNLPTGV